MHDLRSTSAREAGVTIQVLARSLDFESAAVKMLPSLVKLIQVANKILSEVGHQVIKAILMNTDTSRLSVLL